LQGEPGKFIRRPFRRVRVGRGTLSKLLLLGHGVNSLEMANSTMLE
jgi:hypothetical protein